MGDEVLGLVLMVQAGVRLLIQDAGSCVSGPYVRHVVSGTLLTHLVAAPLAPVLLPTCLPGWINALPEHPADCSCLRQSRRPCSVSAREVIYF